MNVGYLDWEWEDWAHYERLEYICGPDLARDSRILYCNCKGATLAEQVSSLKRKLAEHDIQFIIVDSAAAACGGEPEKAEVALKFFHALNSLRVSSLVIAHTTKDGNEWKPFGSAFWFDESRLIYHVARGKDSTDGNLRVGFFCRKNNRGVKPPSSGFTMRFADNRLKIETTEIKDIGGFESKLSNDEKIIQTLENDGASMLQAICTNTGLPDKVVSPILSRLKTTGVVRLDNHHWRLVERKGG